MCDAGCPLLATLRRSARTILSMNFFGYRVDTVHRVVTTPRGRMVRVEPKAFDLLLYFTQHPEETISRERLIADVWDGKFVTDDAVMVAVYALRQAFEDDARAPKFMRRSAAADIAGSLRRRWI